jgi:hypothetical protein
MDYPQLAGATVAALAPGLPYLLALGGKAVDGAMQKAGAELGTVAWEQARGLWARLQDWAGSGPQQAMVAELAAAPGDEPTRQALAWHLAKALEQDPELARAMQGLIEAGGMNQAKAGGHSAIAQGHHNQAVAGGGVAVGTISGSVINTGGGSGQGR